MVIAAALFSLVLLQTEPSLGAGRAHVKALRGHSSVQTLPSLKRLSAELQNYGQESKVVSETLFERDALFVYQRVMAVSKWARGIELELVMDKRGRLVSGNLNRANKEAPTAYGSYRPLVKLKFPLEGAWNVLWGGRTRDENRHASVSDMRFALDLLVRKNGGTSKDRGTHNEDYFAWNQHVLAPADGIVVLATDGIVDNTPRRAVGGNLYGNVLVIDHGTDEFTLLGHLKQGSLLVKPGDRVTTGQRLARVGNSGMSTEPHLHFQLMDTGNWRTAHGLPFEFHEFFLNGNFTLKAEPHRGDVLMPVSAEAHR